MNNLYNQADVNFALERIGKLSPDSPPQWGKMNVAQMLAHCNISLETAMGKHTIKPLLIGRIIGPLVRKKVLGEKPFARNLPTDNSYKFTGPLDFEEERAKIMASLKQFSEGGPGKCTTDPHPFFGRLRPDQWAVFQWKHLDHHLRQFAV